MSTTNDTNGEICPARAESMSLSAVQVEFINALSRDYTIAYACKYCRIDRSVFMDWYENDELFRRKIDEYKEMLIDNAERCMHRLAEKGNYWAAKYILECFGRERGWGNKEEKKEEVFTPQITIAEGRLLGIVDGRKNSYNKKKSKKKKQELLARSESAAPSDMPASSEELAVQPNSPEHKSVQDD